MLTRKQRWRKTRTRKNAWGDLPPEVLESILTTGMSKSISWDHSYAAALKIRANKAAEVARRAEKEDHRLKAAAAAAAAIPRSVSCSSLAPKRSLFHRSNTARNGLDGIGGAPSPRRASTVGAAQQQRRRFLPHRRGVSFNTQVKMVLIPKREEFSDAERIRLWWGRDDYAAFRQVLIDWKRANAHRISHSDNILSINLSDIDEEEEVAESAANDGARAPLEAVPSCPFDYNHAHEEAAAAADATAQAAAAVVAAAHAAAEAAKASAAAITCQANAAAAAAAAGAATAAEVAAMEAEELEHEQHDLAEAHAEAAVEQQKLEEHDRLADAWEVEVAVAKAMSAAVAAAGGGVFGGEGMMAAGSPEPTTTDEDGFLSDIAEGHEGQEDQDEPRIGACSEGGSGTARANTSKIAGRSSFTTGVGGSSGPGFPDWSSTGGSNGTFPLRRAYTQSGESASPPAASGGRLKEVPLSESQATTEALRAWRKGFDARLTALTAGDDAGDDGRQEERERATSMQHQTRNYAQLGRATALVMSQTKWASDVGVSGDTAATAAAAAPAAAAAIAAVEAAGTEVFFGGNGVRDGGGGGSREGDEDDAVDQRAGREQGEGVRERAEGDDGKGDEGEKLSRTLSDQEWSASRRTSLRLAAPAPRGSALLSNPVMAAFERQRKEAAARQAEIDEAQAARASAMVRAAAAAAATASSVAATASEASKAAKAAKSSAKAIDPSASADEDWQRTCGGGPSNPSVLQLGLNDAPGSAVAASAVGLRMAADGVSNLSLRSKDSVENLQELGEHAWGPVALSSSA